MLYIEYKFMGSSYYFKDLFNDIAQTLVFQQDAGISIADYHYIPITIRGMFIAPSQNYAHTNVFQQIFWVSLSFLEVRKNLAVTDLFPHWSTADLSELINIHS